MYKIILAYLEARLESYKEKQRIKANNLRVMNQIKQEWERIINKNIRDDSMPEMIRMMKIVRGEKIDY